MNYDLTLYAILKRVAYDAAEQGVAQYIVCENTDDEYTEQHSETIANEMLEFYEGELKWKQAKYDRPLLAYDRLFVNGQELYDDIEQVKAIITILKTNKHE